MTKLVASNESGRILRKSVEDATSLLKEVADDIRVQHAAGEDGLSLCRLRTKAVDRSVREIWDAILEELPESDRLEVGKRVTDVAHGGYARGEMTPGSFEQSPRLRSWRLKMRQFLAPCWSFVFFRVMRHDAISL